MIRKLSPDDFDQWKQLRLEAVRLCPTSFGESYSGVEQQDQEWFAQSLQRGDVFAYHKDEKMVGLIGTFTMQPSNMRHRAVIFGLYVKGEYRKLGIASALLEYALTHISDNHQQAHLTVAVDNSAAIALYKKLGFVIYGTDARALLIDGKYYDEYMMVKDNF